MEPINNKNLSFPLNYTYNIAADHLQILTKGDPSNNFVSTTTAYIKADLKNGKFYFTTVEQVLEAITKLIDFPLKSYNLNTETNDSIDVRLNFATEHEGFYSIITIKYNNQYDSQTFKISVSSEDPQNNHKLFSAVKEKILTAYPSKLEEDSILSEIKILSQNEGYLTLKPIQIAPQNTPLSTNYESTFEQEVHQKLLTKIGSENRNGLVILNGEPGTGKSAYIKTLIHSLSKLDNVKKRDIIMLTRSEVPSINTPFFKTVLSEASSPIVIIEDGDLLVKDRRNPDSMYDILLGLSDTIIAEFLNVTFIITTNLKSKELDPAIRRKGRLLLRHTFTKRTKSEALAIASHYNLNTDLIEKLFKNENDLTTLAEIFNAEDDNDTLSENNAHNIGFN